MRLSLISALLLAVEVVLAQVVPYPAVPDWISNANSHRATGLGIADINGDGFKDIVVANGNDMARQNLVVYYNLGDGSFPQNPDWSSSDVDYHGHLACGDLDSDGDIDVVVSVYIGPAGFSEPGELKVYYNQGNELESTPSFISNPFYTFSCALGDADGDGDLDIAAVAGEPYGGILDYGKIFLNNNGTFQPEAEWLSSVMMGALDVEFGDINQDGFLDVIFVCEGTPNMIYLAGPGGVIDPVPDWQSAESVNYINSVDIGYEPGLTVVTMTENSQLGGEGKVRRYNFNGNIPASSPADWYSGPFGYGSGIIMDDIDKDGNLDLIYGGWWLPVKVAFGDGSGFETESSYTSLTSSVVETILLADLGGEDESYISESFTIDDARDSTNILVMAADVVERILTVHVNGVLLESTDYCHLHGKSWICFKDPLLAGDFVELGYFLSYHADMVVTNWDSNKGNYIFYNTEGGVGTEEYGDLEPQFNIYPNPATDKIQVFVPESISNIRISIFDPTGRLIYSQDDKRNTDMHAVNCQAWPTGLYLVNISGDGHHMSAKFFKE